MANRVPVGWHTVTPRLVVRDTAKLVKFLKDAFGASGEFRADMPSLITIGDSILMVNDVDDTYRRALEAGAVSIEEPAQMPYGDRRAMVTDPCGNDWQIATYAEPKPANP